MKSTTNKNPSWRRLPVIVTLLLGVSISIAGYFFAENLEQHSQQEKFDRNANELLHAIERSVETTLSVLKSIRGLYAASQRVDRDEFGEFVNSLDVSNEVQALEWIPRVPHSQRSEIERRARQDGLERFRIIERKTRGLMAPAGIREEYFPVYYVEPRRGNEAAIGYDLASNPTRKQALDQARDSGEMTATGRITLVQETGLQFGFLTCVPIYGKGQPVGTVSERRRSLIGFGLGVFRLGNLVDAAIDPLISQKSFISIQIHDDGAAPNARLIYPAAAPRTISSPMATLVPVERSIDEYLLNCLSGDPSTKDIPVIILTGRTFDGGEDVALKRDMVGRGGAVAYFNKPVDMDLLLAELQKQITLRRAHLEQSRLICLQSPTGRSRS